jgi:hypothetical protein
VRRGLQGASDCVEQEADTQPPELGHPVAVEGDHGKAAGNPACRSSTVTTERPDLPPLLSAWSRLPVRRTAAMSDKPVSGTPPGGALGLRRARSWQVP